MERGVLYGKYEVGRLLGCGAFAKVYHARNLHNGQSVAIKIINKNKVIGTNLMDNVKREITIMGRLRHPNIVRLYEVMACKSKVYFVLEFAKGGELFAKVQKARFSEELSRKYFQQLISAVGFCHSRGVFHRDLKPENLLLDEFGNLKVSDFGLSAVTGQIRPDTGLLHTLCGTPAYVAPEILTKKGYDGAKIDVWSCGVILYVLTAGVLPFNDPNLMAMYKKIYKGEFRCPKWMSSELKRFLSRLLETNPKARITIDEITRDPWFKKGGLYKDKNPDYEFQFYHDDYEYDLDDSFFKQAELQQQQSEVSEASSSSSSSISKSLNAFDLIAFSSGLDLSGLFDESFNPIVDGETFLSAKTADEIIDTIGEVAGEMNVKLCRRKKDGVVDLVGTNGNFIVRMVISQLTEQLVIVEVKKKGGNSASYNNIWQKKLMPRLSELIYDPQSQPQPAVVEEEADAAAEDTAPVAVAAADSVQ